MLFVGGKFDREPAPTQTLANFYQKWYNAFDRYVLIERSLVESRSLKR
ncbi:MAG TPA: hypothetical protein VK211_25430 [Kamptonema sp.]|nr:hypothetical protein [Kamptonema sp.]